jgi:YHS domain-containing protein
MKFLFLRILLPLLLFLIVRSVVKALFSSSRPSTQPAEAPPRVPDSGELKKDPVCGTYVSSVASLSEKVGRETVYFCSDECRKQFSTQRR